MVRFLLLLSSSLVLTAVGKRTHSRQFTNRLHSHVKDARNEIAAVLEGQGGFDNSTAVSLHRAESTEVHHNTFTNASINDWTNSTGSAMAKPREEPQRKVLQREPSQFENASPLELSKIQQAQTPGLTQKQTANASSQQANELAQKQSLDASPQQVTRYLLGRDAFMSFADIKALKVLHDKVALRDDAMGSLFGTLFKCIVFLGILIGVYWCYRKANTKIEIREWFGIGELLRKMGVDQFDTFTLTLLLDNVENATALGGSPLAIKVNCNKQSMMTDFLDAGRLHQTLQITVPQGSTTIKIQALVEGRSKPRVVAYKDMDVKKVIQLGEKHKKTILTLSKQSKELVSDLKLNVTFFLQDQDDESQSDKEHVSFQKMFSSQSPEMQLLIQQQKKLRETKKVSDDENSSPSKKQADEPLGQLELLASTCKGLVKMTGALGKKTQYYLAVYTSDKEGKPKDFPPGSAGARLSWHLGWWSDEASFTKGNIPVGSIFMLRITNVYPLPDDEKKDGFCVRHVNTAKQKEDVILDRLDRSREVWVECLHVFIEQLRKLRRGEVESDHKKGKSTTKSSSQSETDEDSSTHRRGSDA